MSSTATFYSSRYMEYDYDNECIIGFDADDEDENMIFGLLGTKKLKLQPMQLSVELVGDRWWRKDRRGKKRNRSRKKQKPVKQNTANVKPPAQHNIMPIKPCHVPIMPCVNVTTITQQKSEEK